MSTSGLKNLKAEDAAFLSRASATSRGCSRAGSSARALANTSHTYRDENKYIYKKSDEFLSTVLETKINTITKSSQFLSTDTAEYTTSAKDKEE